MASAETKVKVASYFLQNIPINEMQYAICDVETLLQDSNAFNQNVQVNIVHDYNVDQYIHVDLPNGGKMLLSKYNEADSTNYIDPRTNTVYKVDHLERKVVGESGSGKGSSHDKLRGELQTLIDEYVKTFYKKDKAVGMVFVNGDTLTVCISGINTNLPSFWTGNIRTTYKVDLSAGKWKIKATCLANSHYFEDGNVQLKGKLVDRTTPAEKNDAQSICKAIETHETNWSNNLDTFYVDLHERTMKRHMRRSLPITRALFDWGGREAKLADEFRKKAAGPTASKDESKENVE